MPELTSIESVLESLLFAAGDPVSLERLSFATSVDKKEIEIVIAGMMDSYKNENRGILIKRLNDSFQMCTNNKNAEYIKKFVRNPSRKKLTQTQMETLSIIAYKQPVTKPQIEEIRGVNSDHAVNRLVELGLVEEKGRLNTVGKPILFVTSEEFLRHFSLSNVGGLPPLKDSVELNKQEVLESEEIML